MARAVIVAEVEDRAAVTLALFRAIWSDGRSLATSQAVVEELASAGIETAVIAARIDTEEAVMQLDKLTDEAATRGVFGSPTMIVNNEMFFGNDRIDFLREELARVEAAA
ncbi:DSBA-like thioredoxin domain protein [Ochrobactrum quorumnocens]|uniref:DSBA-like thioredoxin domain protein n=2 Tax=Ochrobactrum quorumnocens TaxID=271865 RepID=A0A248UET7_9HYPH|nr:DSBA-like thioredoxin domain protein [[Ochrobactrum] quorumnocens]